MKVFLADDSPIIRKRLSDMISEMKGVEVSGEAENCPQALQAIWGGKPDVAILDIRMPGGSGIEVLEKVKKTADGLTVIILTNYADPQYRERCIRGGATFFFDKSTEFGKVGRVLSHILHRKTMEKIASIGMSLILCIFLISSCIGGGPQLSFDRGGGEPGGEPGPGLPLPPLTGNRQFAASGGGFFESERFTAFGTQTSIDGGLAASPSYRTVSPALSLGQQGILGPTPAEGEESP